MNISLLSLFAHTVYFFTSIFPSNVIVPNPWNWVAPTGEFEQRRFYPKLAHVDWGCTYLTCSDKEDSVLTPRRQRE